MLAHKATLKGIFAVDAGSTQTVGQIVAKYGLQSKMASGGFDLTPQTLSAIKAGSLGFTIDQQPYLQGFLPALYLYLFNLSGGLVNPPETDTGLTFVTKANVGPYQSHHVQVRGFEHPGEATSSASGARSPSSTTGRIRAWMTALAAGDWTRADGPSPRRPARRAARERQGNERE